MKLLKSVTIVTESISDNNDTNKHNNCLNLICMLTLLRMGFFGGAHG